MTAELEQYLIKKYPNLYTGIGEQEPFTLFGFECSDGWFRIILWLSESIQNHIDSHNNWAAKSPATKPIEQVKVVQVKEKFAGLRFYYGGGDDVIRGMVALAETIAYNTCEATGATDGVGRNVKGWIKTHHKSIAKNPKDWHPVDDEELIEILAKIKGA
jgi:hypothetical protein